MTVVGTTVVNDTFETSPGHGGFVTIEWLESAAPEASADPYIVQLAPGTDADTFAESLPASLRVDVNPPVKHPAIQNVERIASLPGVLAAIICALAAASTAHAMVLTIRRARRQLAIWQSLGFTRADARAAVGWHAMTVAVAGLVAGVIIGLVVGHLMWQVITDRLGVESPSAVSIVGVCSLVVGAIVLIRATAAVLARRAIRAPIAAALRAE
jgi:predicted lysophospholipase L1 biosynthesis ABC-type transport system permease subunit